jgi:hypothetical protein
MIGVPQLCGNKDVFPRNPSSGKACPQRLAHFTLVPVSFRTVEVSKSSFQRVSRSTYRCGWIRNQGAKPEYRHMAGSVAERQSRIPKSRRFRHDHTSVLPVGRPSDHWVMKSTGEGFFAIYLFELLQ